ncbi:hypothetical protein [Novosphingobium sp. PhB165]|uniref:hypothetical protein n=1 Tax=Novosphingobium sp. PhB165 TaxID=2485105 RepID=UPI001047A5FC|nr:hypothetical protein [Novosphingobium sp. PhB165]
MTRRLLIGQNVQLSREGKAKRSKLSKGDRLHSIGSHDRSFINRRDGKLSWILSSRQFPILLRFTQA